MTMNDNETAKCLLDNNFIMTVATANSKGKPWVSPVGYSVDEANNLYWLSSKDAEHSQNIRSRPEVAIVIAGETPEHGLDGVYFDATAEELSDNKEIQNAIDHILPKRSKKPRFGVHSLADVTGEAAWRVYKATPKAAWKRGDSVVNGQAITVRNPVNL